MSDEQPPERETNYLGAGIAIGAGVGAALFAATQNPVWIGVFAGAGVAIGAALSKGR